MAVDPDPCERCGEKHIAFNGGPGCQAHKKHVRPLSPCGQSPVRGATVCRFHGGNTPGSKAAVKKRRQEAAAQKAVQTLGIKVETTPTEALLEEVRWTAGHVQWLRAKVQELEDKAAEAEDEGHPLVWGLTSKTEKNASEFAGTDYTEEAAPSIWYTLYLKERQHLVAVSSAAIKAGVEERMVRLAERQGDMVFMAITAILKDLMLSPQQQDMVQHVVPKHLRLLAGGQAAS